MTTKKKLAGGLVGVDGNAFSILGRFRRDARTQGWPTADIDAVLDRATAGDYHNLLAVIMEQYEDPTATVDGGEL